MCTHTHPSLLQTPTTKTATPKAAAPKARKSSSVPIVQEPEEQLQMVGPGEGDSDAAAWQGLSLALLPAAPLHPRKHAPLPQVPAAHAGGTSAIAGFVPAMMQQMLARQQEETAAAASKRRREEAAHELELQQKRLALDMEAAAQRLKLAKVSAALSTAALAFLCFQAFGVLWAGAMYTTNTQYTSTQPPNIHAFTTPQEAKSSGLDAHLPLILGGSTQVAAAEATQAKPNGAKEQQPAEPKNAGIAKAAAAAKTPPGSPAAAGSHGTPRRGRTGETAKPKVRACVLPLLLPLPLPLRTQASNPA